jgi:hypothetical protein
MGAWLQGPPSQVDPPLLLVPLLEPELELAAPLEPEPAPTPELEPTPELDPAPELDPEPPSAPLAGDDPGFDWDPQAEVTPATRRTSSLAREGRKGGMVPERRNACALQQALGSRVIAVAREASTTHASSRGAAWRPQGARTGVLP